MPLRTYDPKKVIVTFGGVPISGFADGEFVNADRTNDMFTMVSGADGNATRSKSNDKTGTVQITLLQTSESNKYLSAIQIVDENANEGVLPLLISDVSGTSFVASPFAYIAKPVNVTEAKDVGNRVWTFQCVDMDIFESGVEAQA